MGSQREPNQRRFIREINGTRGLALVLVVVFHLFGNGRVSGGVDVFLVISAYLLTASLLRRIPNAPTSGSRNCSPFGTFRSFQLGRHYSRVAGRLFPSAAVVLASVGIAGYFLVPSPQHSQLFREILASALYYENWELISSQLSYAAAGPNTSPLQHFWSLAVQGQFFAVWPLVFAVATAFLVSSRMPTRAALFVLILGSTFLSAWYAFTMVQFDQQTAYFSTFTRFWELGAGALLAFLPARIRLPQFIREALAWCGIAMIVSSGFILDGGQLFPGPAALWPVLATLFIIVGAVSGDRETSVAQALSVPPVMFLSRISYQLYLWHWPILIFYLLGRGQEAVGPRGAAVVLVISVFAAWGTERLLHRDRSVPSELYKHRAYSRPLSRPILATAAVSLVALGAGLALAADATNQRAALAAASQPSADHPGALALTDENYANFVSLVPPVPEADSADADLPNLYSRKCVQNWRSEPGTWTKCSCARTWRRIPQRSPQGK